MKIYFYTALLFAFVFMTIPEAVQSQNDNYNRVYRSVNNKVEGIEVQTNVPSNVRIADTNQTEIQQGDALDAATTAELDSLLKNRIGVRRVMEGRKSVLRLELDPASKTSLTLLGCIELGSRYPETGKATPDPKITGLPVVRKRMERTVPALIASATSTQPAAGTTTTPTPTQETTSVTPVPRQTTGTPTPTSQPFSASSNARVTTSNAATTSTLSRQFGQTKLFRSMKVSLVDNADKAFLKKYSIVLGSFKDLNNADFVKRTFNALGERVILVKGSSDIYIALLGSYATEAEAVQKFDSFSKKYTEGMSRARRISKYGIPLDDLWIMVNE